MATHSSILAWENPMDRGAWWAVVLGAGCKQLDMTEHSRRARQTFSAAGSQATSLLPGHHLSLSTRPPDPVSDGNFSGIASGQAPYHLVSHPSGMPGIPWCSAGLGQLAGMTRRVLRVQKPPACPHLPALGWEESGGLQLHTPQRPSAQPPPWGRRDSPATGAKGTACTAGEAGARRGSESPCDGGQAQCQPLCTASSPSLRLTTTPPLQTLLSHRTTDTTRGKSSGPGRQLQPCFRLLGTWGKRGQHFLP